MTRMEIQANKKSEFGIWAGFVQPVYVCAQCKHTSRLLASPLSNNMTQEMLCTDIITTILIFLRIVDGQKRTMANGESLRTLFDQGLTLELSRFSFASNVPRQRPENPDTLKRSFQASQQCSYVFPQNGHNGRRISSH